MKNKEHILVGAILLLACCCIFLAAGWVVFHQHKLPDVVTARAFKVVDEQGNIRAQLSIIKPPPPSLPRWAQDYKELYYKELWGTIWLQLFDENQESHFTVGVYPDGRPFARMNDRDGNVVWRAP